MKECCANCYHVVKVSGSDKYRCWEEPSVCDHPRLFTTQEVREYRCSEYLSKKKRFCRDCRYFIDGCCRNKNNATIDEDFIYLRRVDDTREECSLFDRGAKND
ncbi:MAG: hypothetical protein HDQ88_03870 [Clostridia bacterium]|nr:hypothetical protein [Clostridia bacterium]